MDYFAFSIGQRSMLEELYHIILRIIKLRVELKAGI